MGRVLGADRARVHQLLRERLVFGQLLQLAAVEQVRPRVADVADEQVGPDAAGCWRASLAIRQRRWSRIAAD